MAQEPARPRPAPADRFAGTEHLYDLQETVRQLRAEHPDPRHGHRQLTLFKHPTGTMSLFDWEAGGELAEHKAAGYVTIHCLHGRLMVRTEAHEHELSTGRLLVMAPEVRHSVQALEASQMLLIVNLV